MEQFEHLTIKRGSNFACGNKLFTKYAIRVFEGHYLNCNEERRLITFVRQFIIPIINYHCFKSIIIILMYHCKTWDMY